MDIVHTRRIDALLVENAHGVDINGRDQTGRTPISIAAENEHVDVIKILLRHNPELLAPDVCGRNVLHCALHSGANEICQTLLEYAHQQGNAADLMNAKELYVGAEQCFLVKGRDKGEYSWHYVLVDRGLLSIFKQVISRGQVDVERYGSIISSGWGNCPTQDIQDEMNRRFSPNAIPRDNVQDLTPLHYAIIHANGELAIQMLTYGADCDLSDRFGLTPLHLAAMLGETFIVDRLLAAGADVDARDDKGRTPMDLARLNEHEAAEKLLGEAKYCARMKIFTEQKMHSVAESLSEDTLKRVINDGKDIIQHMIQQLRLLESDIQIEYRQLDTTPVTQPEGATGGSGPDHQTL